MNFESTNSDSIRDAAVSIQLNIKVKTEMTSFLVYLLDSNEYKKDCKTSGMPEKN